jgi:hypothetical protein
LNNIFIRYNFQFTETRIDWCREVINEYFKEDGLKKILDKERRRKEKHKERETLNCDAPMQTKYNKCQDFHDSQLGCKVTDTSDIVKPTVGANSMRTDLVVDTDDKYASTDHISKSSTENKVTVDNKSIGEYNVV